MSYFQLFLQSAAIETAFLLLFFRNTSRLRVASVSLFANAFTHPLLVFLFLAVPGKKLLPWLLAGELSVILVEAIIFFQYLKKGFGMSLVGALLANLLSWELGPRLSYWMFQRHWVF